MEGWLKVTLLLCAFGTLREIRPSEPFVSEFLSGEWRNVTAEQLNQEVYPVGTYSVLSLLLVVFLVTDFLRFKPVIILSGLSGIAVYAILLWTTSLEWLQVSQFAYGLYMATEVAYFTYIYAKVAADKYPKASSYTRMAALTGRFLSGVTSQLLVMFHLMDYRQLNYITLAAQIAATFWALWLPAVRHGIYFHRQSVAASALQPSMLIKMDGDKPVVQHEKRAFGLHLAAACTLVARHARAAYTRGGVVAWSLLYAASMALFVQAQTYMQLLWIQMQGEETQAYNGFVEAAQTLLGAGGAYVSSAYGPSFVPAAAAAVQGAAVFVGTHAGNVHVSYAGYVVMGTLFHYTITLASAKIARQLSDESCFGLIFGINTFVGTALQALLTFVLINQLALTLPAQYYVLSGLFGAVAVLWAVGWAAHVWGEKQTFDLALTLPAQYYVLSGLFGAVAVLWAVGWAAHVWGEKQTFDVSL